MKDKKLITPENYKEIMLKRGIISCWILLAICLIVKICGGNYFSIVCNSENFVLLCEYIDNSWIYSVIAYLTFNIGSVLLLIIVRDDKRIFTLNTLYFVLCTSLYWVFKLLIEIGLIYINIHIITVLDLLILYILLFIFTKKPLKSIIAIILMYVFTFISVFVKNTGISSSVSEYALTGLIFMIDYYIMLILTFLYSIKFKRRKQ